MVMMGKKKPQKTKELSVAIAEASSTAEVVEETSTPQHHQTTPRKRGRPRKIIEKIEISSEEYKPQDQKLDQEEEGESKKARSIKEEEEQQKETSSSAACTRFSKDDSKGEPSRNRARRKSKPRKSS